MREPAGRRALPLRRRSDVRVSRHLPPRRDPVNELYDHACELVESAAAIRQAAAEPTSVDAVPALLGCVETALRDLARVADELERASARGDSPRRRERAAHGHRNLRVALEDAAVAARVAQALAARAAER